LQDDLRRFWGNQQKRQIFTPSLFRYNLATVMLDVTTGGLPRMGCLGDVPYQTENHLSWRRA
jgi:hypothetical protein